jgi:hypothetical protein
MKLDFILTLYIHPASEIFHKILRKPFIFEAGCATVIVQTRLQACDIEGCSYSDL